MVVGENDGEREGDGEISVGQSAARKQDQCSSAKPEGTAKETAISRGDKNDEGEAVVCLNAGTRLSTAFHLPLAAH